MLHVHNPSKIIKRLLSKRAATFSSTEVMKSYVYFINVFLDIMSCSKHLLNVGFLANANGWCPSRKHAIHECIDRVFTGNVSVFNRLRFSFTFLYRLLFYSYCWQVSWSHRFEYPPRIAHHIRYMRWVNIYCPCHNVFAKIYNARSSL